MASLSHACSVMGCGYTGLEPCPTHKPKRHRPAKARARHHREYNRQPWKRLSTAIKRQRPLCEDCHAAGRLTPSAEVHHVEKWADNPHRAYDPTNLRALCKACHAARTARGE